MKRRILLPVFLAVIMARIVRAQPLPSFTGITPSTVTASTITILPAYLGSPLPLNKGPWLLGEVLFLSKGQVVSDYAWRDRVHGRRGTLYTLTDMQSDADSLMTFGKFDKVTPLIFAIPNSPVPAEFSTLVVSTTQARLVFDVIEKPPAVSTAPTKAPSLPASVSGLILTPTAYRSSGRYNTPGLGLDFNAIYFIGRLYGKNTYPDSPNKTNYIDRLGQWLLSADAKMQLQSEASLRPAAAAGVQGIFAFRDAAQPNIQSPTTSVQVNSKSTQLLSDAYFVVSKKLGPARTSIGVMQGNFGRLPSMLSEFLTPEALKYYLNPTQQGTVASQTVVFANVMALLSPTYPIGVEILKFQGATRNPYLINFKLGRLLRLNFDIGYLKFNGGYDVLGLVQFRFSEFPRY